MNDINCTTLSKLSIYFINKFVTTEIILLIFNPYLEKNSTIHVLSQYKTTQPKNYSNVI